MSSLIIHFSTGINIIFKNRAQGNREITIFIQQETTFFFAFYKDTFRCITTTTTAKRATKMS